MTAAGGGAAGYKSANQWLAACDMLQPAYQGSQNLIVNFSSKLLPCDAPYTAHCIKITMALDEHGYYVLK